MATTLQSKYDGYMLDTSVISALAPDRPDHLPAYFPGWLHAHNAQLFIPCIAIAEIAQGIAKLRRSGGKDRAKRLDHWLENLITGFGDRILPLDTAAAQFAGRISDEAVAKGRHPGFADVAIAALAQRAGHLLLTRNLKHFEPLGVACANPMTTVLKT